jgi:hypothetical protein
MTQYANLYFHTDVRPYEVISQTKTTITLRGMTAVIDPEWKPVFHIGGFMANCSNQDEQKWIITSDPDGLVMKAYLRKDGRFYSRYGRHVLSDEPRCFHDYNL